MVAWSPELMAFSMQHKGLQQQRCQCTLNNPCMIRCDQLQKRSLQLTIKPLGFGKGILPTVVLQPCMLEWHGKTFNLDRIIWFFNHPSTLSPSSGPFLYLLPGLPRVLHRAVASPELPRTCYSSNASALPQSLKPTKNVLRAVQQPLSAWNGSRHAPTD